MDTEKKVEDQIELMRKFVKSAQDDSIYKLRSEVRHLQRRARYQNSGNPDSRDDVNRIAMNRTLFLIKEMTTIDSDEVIKFSLNNETRGRLKQLKHRGTPHERVLATLCLYPNVLKAARFYLRNFGHYNIQNYLDKVSNQFIKICSEQNKEGEVQEINISSLESEEIPVSKVVLEPKDKKENETVKSNLKAKRRKEPFFIREEDKVSNVENQEAQQKLENDDKQFSSWLQEIAKTVYSKSTIAPDNTLNGLLQYKEGFSMADDLRTKFAKKQQARMKRSKQPGRFKISLPEYRKVHSTSYGHSSGVNMQEVGVRKNVCLSETDVPLLKPVYLSENQSSDSKEGSNKNSVQTNLGKNTITAKNSSLLKPSYLIKGQLHAEKVNNAKQKKKEFTERKIKELHPSWTAKLSQRELQKNSFCGKKIKFD